jgi:H+-transporting ATPase
MAAVADPLQNNMPLGLTSDEARTRLQTFGPNSMPEADEALWRRAVVKFWAPVPWMPEADEALWRRAVVKFWAPVPWMLEAALVLQLALGEYIEAAVIGLLLVFNAVLGRAGASNAQCLEGASCDRRIGKTGRCLACR